MSDFYDCSRKKLEELSIMEIEWLRQVLECLPEDVNVTWGVNDLRETYDTISGKLTERQVDVNNSHVGKLYGKCFINPERYKIIHIIGPNNDNKDLSEWEYEMYIKNKDYKTGIDYWKPKYDYEKDGYATNYASEECFFNDKKGNLYWSDAGDIEQWEEYPANKFNFIKTAAAINDLNN
jgi:hypothetical protein